MFDSVIRTRSNRGMEDMKSTAPGTPISESRKLTASRLVGTLVGAGAGYMTEKSPQAAMLGAGIGLAATYVLERLAVKVGQRLIYQFVNK